MLGAMKISLLKIIVNIKELEYSKIHLIESTQKENSVIETAALTQV